MWDTLSQWLRGDFGGSETTADTARPPGAPEGLRELESATLPTAPPGGFDTRGLLGQALDERQLFEAWERVRDNHGAAGTDGQDLASFGQNLLGRLQQLRSEVIKGSYQPQPLMRVPIPKADGSQRWLAIPSVRDRVLQTAVANVLRPRLEPEFEDASYGYRPGRSVGMAVARVARFRDTGCTAVLDADIEGFFDHVHHDTLLRQLRKVVNDPGLLDMVALWLAAVVREGGRSWLLTCGLPQGSPLSPMLSNLYLDDLDEAVLAKFPGLVRYADDFVVLLRSPEQAQEALALVRASLAKLRLKLNESKTRITNFDTGFTFLGVRFTGRLMEAVDPAAEPWVLPKAGDRQAATRHEVHQAIAGTARGLALLVPDPELAQMPRADLPAEPAPARSLDASGDPALDPEEPGPGGEQLESPLVRLSAEPVAAALLQSLYVGEPGTWLLKEGERIVVSHERQVRASVPLGQLDQIAVMANAMLSTALLRDCARRRIAVYIADPEGGDASVSLERGSLPDLELFDLQRRRHASADFNTHLARSYVEGKLHNAKLILRRFTRREGREKVDEVLRRIDDSLRRLPGAPDCATVRGLEGAAARAYFEGLRTVVPPGIGFGGRRRRPPQDPVNALLSFGYTVLAANLHTLVRLSGLNVHIGALHATASGSQALVSDLMEEFRSPVVDAVVVTLLRDGRLCHEDFEHDPGGELPCRLRREGRKRYLEALELKLESRFIHPRHKKVLDMRRAMQSQVQHYLAVLRRQEPVYLPIKFK